jgi:hypothetical protein
MSPRQSSHAGHADRQTACPVLMAVLAVVSFATVVAVASAGCVVASAAPPGTPGDPPPEVSLEMRVESEVFGDAEEPLSRSTTLFCDGVVWDFLETLQPDGTLQVSEIVLHDPARERVVVIDPERNLKIEIGRLRLERLSVSLSTWARQADDPVIRWSGETDFGDAITEEGSVLTLEGPRVLYRVEYQPAASPRAAVGYRRFADTAVLLRALLHPGGLLPFPRMAINRRVAAAGGIPAEVVFEIASPVPLLPGGSRFRSIHAVHPRLLDEDRRRIDEAAARVAVAEAVTIADYAGSHSVSE